MSELVECSKNISDNCHIKARKRIMRELDDDEGFICFNCDAKLDKLNRGTNQDVENW